MAVAVVVRIPGNGQAVDIVVAAVFFRVLCIAVMMSVIVAAVMLCLVLVMLMRRKAHTNMAGAAAAVHADAYERRQVQHHCKCGERLYEKLVKHNHCKVSK